MRVQRSKYWNEPMASVDALEALVPADLWPLPSYAEMLFIYT